MHEYSLIQSLVDRVEREARQRGATAVRRLEVSVGELAGVDPDLFRAAYEAFRPGTVCADAALQVVTRPAGWSCPTCGKAFARGDVLRCADCEQPARMGPDGDALILEAIEMEVP